MTRPDGFQPQDTTQRDPSMSAVRSRPAARTHPREPALSPVTLNPFGDCLLYTFVDIACLLDRSPELVAQQLCDGGSDLIQLRAKDLPPDKILSIAERILPLTQRAGVGLVINDHPRIALAVGAQACHLGQEDFFDTGHSHRSELLPSNSQVRLGLSSHSPSQAQRAMAAQADYIAVGPVFQTPTKPSAKAVTLDYVRWAAANLTLPWFAIGGINLRNLDDVLEAGARRICVVSAILLANDCARACQEFKNRLTSAKR